MQKSLSGELKKYWEEGSGDFEKYYDAPKGIAGFIINRFLEKRMSKVISMLGPVAGKKLLDLGCGSGQFLLSLTEMGSEVTGLDYSRTLLNDSQVRLREAGVIKSKLILADASLIPIRDGYFDSVICIGVIDYVCDMGKVLGEIRRVLKDTGTAVISVPKKFSPFFLFRSRFGGYLRRRLFGLPPILTAATNAQMRKELEKARFKIEDITQVYSTMNIFLVGCK